MMPVDEFLSELTPVIRLQLLRSVMNERKFDLAETLMPAVRNDLTNITDDSKEDEAYYPTLAMCAMNMIHYHAEYPNVIEWATELLDVVEPRVPFSDNTTDDHAFDVEFVPDIKTDRNDQEEFDEANNINGISDMYCVSRSTPTFISIPRPFMMKWIECSTDCYTFWRCAIALNDHEMIQLCIDRTKELDLGLEHIVPLFDGQYKLKPATAKLLLDQQAFANVYQWLCQYLYHSEHDETVLAIFDWFNHAICNDGLQWLIDAGRHYSIQHMKKICICLPQLIRRTLDEQGVSAMRAITIDNSGTSMVLQMEMIAVYGVEQIDILNCDRYHHDVDYYFTALNYNQCMVAQKFMDKIRSCNTCLENLYHQITRGLYPPDIASAKRYNDSLRQIKHESTNPIKIHEKWYRKYAHVMYGIDQGWNVPDKYLRAAVLLKEELGKYLIPELVMCVGEYVVFV